MVSYIDDLIVIYTIINDEDRIMSCTVIAVLNQKGGSGKTTIATNIGVSLQNDGLNVLLVDSDPQGSLRDWNEENEGKVIPVIGLDRPTLDQDLKAVKPGRDIVIIDGAAKLAKLTAVAVKAADFVLIPVQPSPYDVWACGDLVDWIKERQAITDGKPAAAFVVSRAIKNTKLGREVFDALKGYELPIMKSMTTSKVMYPTSASTGETVANSAEIQSIKNELLGLITGKTNEVSDGAKI